MAKKTSGVNKSEEIRQLYRANPEMAAKEIVAALEKRGITVADNLVYLVKGKMKGRASRRKKARKMVAKVAVTTGNHDAIATILKVRGWADQVGGMKRLKALVEALGN